MKTGAMDDPLWEEFQEWRETAPEGDEQSKKARARAEQFRQQLAALKKEAFELQAMVSG